MADPPSPLESHHGHVWSRAAMAVVLLGIALRLFQWLANSSLWLDELMLVRSLTERGLFDIMLGRLRDNQVAPPGYLFATKLAVLAFGDGERALRAVPVGASCLALLLFWRLARSLLEPKGALVATTAMALSPQLISLSGAVKQYSTDVLATILILLVFRTLTAPNGSWRTRALAGAVAGAAGVLSTPSVLVAFPAMAAVVYRRWLRDHERGPATWLPVSVWAALALGGALWSSAMVTPEALEVQTRYWARSGAFAAPLLDYPTWVIDRWRYLVLPGFFFGTYASGWGALGSMMQPLIDVLLPVGGILLLPASILMGGLEWAAIVVLASLLEFGLSILMVYPIDVRTTVFVLPLVLLLVGAMVSLLVRILPPSPSWMRASVAVVSSMSFVAPLVDRPPPYVVQRDREAVQELSRRREAGEPVFAFQRWAEPSLDYYGVRFGVTDVTWLGAYGAPENLVSLSEMAGEPRLWVLFTYTDDLLRDYLLCYLDEVGREAERIVLISDANPTSLHRYDLGDSERVASVDIDAFPLLDQAFVGDAPRCQRRDWAP